jgi:IPT/TIG domain
MRFRDSRFLGIALAAATLAAPAGALASSTIGSPLTATATSGSCGGSTYADTALAAGTLQAPFDGVIVRWRLKLPSGGGSYGYKLRVLRPAGGTNYTGAGTGPAQTAPAAGVNVLTLPAPLPVHAGDLIGIDCPNGAPDPYAFSGPATSKYGFFSPALADGMTSSPTNQIVGSEELINADVVGVPAVSSIAPASGPVAGGTTVTLSGSRLADVTGVTFGGVPAGAVTVVNDSQVTATAPPHPAAGAVDVVATDAAGAGPVVAGDSFTYLPVAVPLPLPLTIAHLRQSHRSWRARTGTTFSFTLSGPARVELAFSQTLAGRRVRGRCVAPTERNRRERACKRASRRGTLSFAGKSGPNAFKFKGRLSRAKKLPSGRYTVAISATNAAGQRSPALTLGFTILR